MRKLRNTLKKSVNIVLVVAMLMSLMSVGVYADDTEPVAVGVELSETRTYVTIEFDREITAATSNLAGRVKISKNGGALYSIGSGSTVTVSGKYMYIKLNSAITTPNNYFQIAADALEEQTAVIKTPVFSGEEPELLEKDSILLEDGGTLVTIRFKGAFKGYPTDESLKNGYISLARSGSSYTEVIPSDDITVRGDAGEIEIYLAEPITGNRSRFKIAAGKIQDKETGNLNLKDIITPYVDTSKSVIIPEVDYIDISDDRYTATIYFTERIKNAYGTASVAQSLLKSHVWVSRGSNDKYETLGGADTITVGTNYLRIKFDQSLSSSRNYIRIDAGSLTDYNGNIIDEEIETGNLTSGVTGSTVKPSYASAFLMSNKKVVIYFTTAIKRNPDITSSELRQKISVSRNGGSYTTLTSSDSVSISETAMTITLSKPLSGSGNKIRISANAIASTAGAVLTSTVTTSSLYAGADSTEDNEYGGESPEYTAIEYAPGSKLVRIYFKDDIRKVSSVDLANYISISRNGSSYTPLSSADQIEIHPSNAISIILATPLTGEGNRFRIYSGAIADYDTGYVMTSTVTTDDVSASGSETGNEPSSGVSDYNGGVKVSLSDDFYTITVKFDEPIYNNMSTIEALKGKIKFAQNGSFVSLDSDDYVRINSEDGELLVILAEPVKNFYAQLKISSGALRDSENKTISKEITTNALGESSGDVRAYIDNIAVADIVSATNSGTSYTATVSGTEAVVELGKYTKAIELLVKIPSDATIGTLNVSGEAATLIKKNDGTIALSCGEATYFLPLDSIDQINAGDTVSISVRDAASSSTQGLESDASKNSYKVESQAKIFAAKLVNASGAQSEIKHKGFAKKRFMISDAKSSNSVFTAIRVENSGMVVPVPSKTETKSGSIYVTADTLQDGTYAAISASHSFTDTPTWAVTPVNELASRLIVDNVTGSKLNPSVAISRSEMVLIMSKTLGILSDRSGASSFFDVISSDSYFEAVMSTVEHGIIAGYPDSTFKPSNKLTREEAMTVVARALRFMKGKSVSKSPDMSISTAEGILSRFTDSKNVGSWAKVDIAECVQAGVVNGDNNGKLNPKANVTRAELIQLMYNILKNVGKLG